MTEKASCSPTCPLKGNGCYAENFPLSLHWGRVATHGTTLDALTDAIRALPEGQLWRHNVAGDLPHTKGTISEAVLEALTEANRGKKGFTYTHHDVRIGTNYRAFQKATQGGFTVNVSCNTASDAVAVLQAYEVPTVCVLPADTKVKSQELHGVQVVTCPATLRDDVTCSSCGMCAMGKREFVIGFPAHGNGKKKADAVARSSEFA